MATDARLYIVKGRVQGVFFRASTRDVATSLGLSGHAVNLPDGTVEVLAAGPETALDELEAWLHKGPATARVTAVESRSTQAPDSTGFRTG